MAAVGISELKNRLGQYVTRGRAGERLVVTERGKPVAIMPPPAPAREDRRIEAMLRKGEALVGFIEQSSRFLKPVYAGDTGYPALTIAELKKGCTTGVVTARSTLHDQRGELCMEGGQKYLVRLGHPQG